MNERLDRERDFHNRWAASTHEDLPDPRQVNEALTSPELRYIHQVLAPIEGRKVMDLGCGLGEASVYFALRGADVTAVDLSPEMVRATELLAQKHGVRVTPHVAAAENLGFKPTDQFDVIYVGNLFHHVDIKATLDRLLPHLKPSGIMVSWDPLAYNPIINIYRWIATEVRTVDEHPLKRADVRLIRERFQESNVEFFWLSALKIFIFMALVQFKNPNKIRYWKAVVQDSKKWAWLYRPLALVDRVLLKLFPFLGWMCWNVVIVGRHPKAAAEHV